MRRAKKRTHWAPCDVPNSAACSDPTASITARTSSMRTSRLGMSATRSESPVPRLSNRIWRENELSRVSKRAKFPINLDIRHPSRHKHEVSRSFA